jgi:hypothetical protein
VNVWHDRDVWPDDRQSRNVEKLLPCRIFELHAVCPALDWHRAWFVDLLHWDSFLNFQNVVECSTMPDSQTPYKGSAADVVRQSRGNAIMRGGTAGDLTGEDWAALLTLYENTCAYCRVSLLLDAPAKHPQKATIDHIVSLTQGGEHTKSNVIPSCWKCNARKGERFIAPLPPPGQPADSQPQSPLPAAGPPIKKLFTPVSAAHVALIIELRHQRRSIAELMGITGLTFNQIAHKLSELQKQGMVPIIGRGRRRK